MVTKKRNKDEQKAQKGRVKVGKLQLNKETVKDLTSYEARQVKGGTGNCAQIPPAQTGACPNIPPGETGACVVSPAPRPPGNVGPASPPPTVRGFIC